MKAVKPHIRLSEGVKGNKYYVTIMSNGTVFNKMYDTLEEAEKAVFEIKSHGKVQGFEYPLDFIDALFGDDEHVQITYIEEHFDENVVELLKTITEREARIIKARLIDGYTLEAVGMQEGVTRDRIRQIEQKALRKLRHPSRLAIMRYGKENLELQDDVDKMRIELLKLKNDLINAIKHPETIELTEEEIELSRLSQSINELDFSVRTHNCLMRAGIKTLSQIVQLKPDDLLRVRNFGRKSLREVINKLNEMGYQLREDTPHEN